MPETVVSESNCTIPYNNNWSWTLNNPVSYNTPIYFTGYPTALNSEEYIRLDWIGIYIAKLRNNGVGFSLFGSWINAGQIQSTGEFKVRVKVINSGKSWWSNYVTIASDVYANMEGSTNQDNVWAWVPDSCIYKFTFNEKIVLAGKTASIIVDIPILGQGHGNTKGVSMRGSTGQHDKRIGVAHISKVASKPTAVYPDLNPADVWITNLTGKPKHIGATELEANVYHSSEETFRLIANGDDNPDITGVSYTGDVNSKSTINFPNLTVKAKNSTADYPTVDNVKLSMDGEGGGKISTEYRVRFFKKPNVTLSVTTLNVNIKHASKYGYVINKYDIGNIPDYNKPFVGIRWYVQSTNETSTWYSYASDSMVNYNPMRNPEGKLWVRADQLVTVKTEGWNAFKMKYEGVQHRARLRFYNPAVQTTFVDDNYNSDTVVNFTFHAIPDEKEQFSYEWLANGVPTSKAPDIVLIGLAGAIVPGNLRYSNKSVTGGYCRSIKMSILRASNREVLYEEIKYTTDQSDDSSLLAGSRFTTLTNAAAVAQLKSKLGPNYTEVDLILRADMCFNFDNPKTTLYPGCYQEWKARLVTIEDILDDIKVRRVFPITSEVAPATHMMLPNVERFGYEISFGEFADLVEGLDVNLSFNVGGVSLTQASYPQYFSSGASPTSHLVVAMGRFIRDKSIFQAECKIKVYLDVAGTRKELADGNAWKNPNAVENTLQSTWWYRPTVEKGEYATYFDVDRFQRFIDKYYPLNGNNYFSPIVREKRGDYINTDFWKMIEDKLVVYSTNMQMWATAATNYRILWLFPQFMHKKGSRINNNNLYQNYWDLLNMFDAYATADPDDPELPDPDDPDNPRPENFATHDYLKGKEYTHNFLGDFTHMEITNRRGGI